jgi:hypothetical protein
MEELHSGNKTIEDSHGNGSPFFQRRIGSGIAKQCDRDESFDSTKIGSISPDYYTICRSAQ